MATIHLFHLSIKDVNAVPPVAVTLARPLHVSKVGQSKEKGKDQVSDTCK